VYGYESIIGNNLSNAGGALLMQSILYKNADARDYFSILEQDISERVQLC
jgi:hypothetical protein